MFDKLNAGTLFCARYENIEMETLYFQQGFMSVVLSACCTHNYEIFKVLGPETTTNSCFTLRVSTPVEQWWRPPLIPACREEGAGRALCV